MAAHQLKPSEGARELERTPECRARAKEAVAMGSWDGKERRVTPDPQMLAVLVESMDRKIDSMDGRLGTMDGRMATMADAMTRFAVAESRLADQQQTIAELRAEQKQQAADLYGEIKGLRDKLAAAETAGAVNDTTTATVSKWVDRVLTALITLGLTLAGVSQLGGVS